MSHDLYPHFAALSAAETEGVDFAVRIEDRKSKILILAPHAGEIEPGSSPIARHIARLDLSLYLFEGLRFGRLHGDLHITSHRFDEPRALAMAACVETIVTVHGRADWEDPTAIWVGGLDSSLADNIAASLRNSGYAATRPTGFMAGTHPNNICNRGRSGKGVQLEIPRSLRRKIRYDDEAMAHLAAAIRRALI